VTAGRQANSPAGFQAQRALGLVGKPSGGALLTHRADGPSGRLRCAVMSRWPPGCGEAGFWTSGVPADPPVAPRVGPVRRGMRYFLGGAGLGLWWFRWSLPRGSRGRLRRGGVR